MYYDKAIWSYQREFYIFQKWRNSTIFLQIFPERKCEVLLQREMRWSKIPLADRNCKSVGKVVDEEAGSYAERRVRKRAAWYFIYMYSLLREDDLRRALARRSENLYLIASF